MVQRIATLTASKRSADSRNQELTEELRKAETSAVDAQAQAKEMVEVAAGGEGRGGEGLEDGTTHQTSLHDTLTHALVHARMHTERESGSTGGQAQLVIQTSHRYSTARYKARARTHVRTLTPVHSRTHRLTTRAYAFLTPLGMIFIASELMKCETRTLT